MTMKSKRCKRKGKEKEEKRKKKEEKRPKGKGGRRRRRKKRKSRRKGKGPKTEKWRQRKGKRSSRGPWPGGWSSPLRVWTSRRGIRGSRWRGPHLLSRRCSGLGIWKVDRGWATWGTQGKSCISIAVIATDNFTSRRDSVQSIASWAGCRSRNSHGLICSALSNPWCLSSWRTNCCP